MLIDFSVKNFRSFREEQRISFVASNQYKDLPENLIDPKLEGREFASLRLLKGLAIYGANAAGKSNVLHALRYLAHMVEDSATNLDEGDSTGTEPFALDPDTVSEPSEFVLRFVVEGVRYHFVLVLNRKRILFESLSAFPKGREQVWYERSWDDAEEAYTWTPARPTDYRRDPNRVKYTRENALYLSTAVKFNDEQLKPIYLWFKDRVCFLRLNADFPPLSPRFTVKQIMGEVNDRARITRLLQHADIGILSARASERELARSDLPKDMPEAVVEKILEKNKHLEITLGHRGAEGREYPLPWEEESSGTQKFFALAGPWLDILKNGYFAGLDEIESSIHPSMVSALLKLFFSDQSNPNAGQLLFTTHNPLLLDTEVMRRDQIWFADKDDEGATHLYPLTDYKPRNKESLVRGYMAGRYGAIPFIPHGLLAEPLEADAKK
ncbi:MAG: ATP-binding protein [Opitutales bacterium]|nr:ATP-binding protein [Opitutales bacterium]